jgi:hypothetical protein
MSRLAKMTETWPGGKRRLVGPSRMSLFANKAVFIVGLCATVGGCGRTEAPDPALDFNSCHDLPHSVTGPPCLAGTSGCRDIACATFEPALPLGSQCGAIEIHHFVLARMVNLHKLRASVGSTHPLADACMTDEEQAGLFGWIVWEG